MNFLDLARRRQSDRGYSDRPVSREQIERCLEAARLAPSACNSQPWFFVVVDDRALRLAMAEKLCDKIMNRFVLSAPVLVAVVAEPPRLIPRLAGLFKGKPYYLLDIGMAVENFCLQATDEGLGSCILGWFDEQGVKRLLGVPKGKRLPLVIALGHPLESAPRAKVRKAPGEIWSYNAYREGKP
jgi:nitroreductase